MGPAGGSFNDLRLAAAGALDQDLACLKCDYNLRGLLPERFCPECGTSVARSMHGPNLRSCDPTWLRRLARGCWYLWAALAGLSLMWAMAYWEPPDWVTGTWAPALLIATFFVGGWWGCWLTTAPEMNALRPEPRLSSRRIFRWAFVGLLTSWFLVIFVGILIGARRADQRRVAAPTVSLWDYAWPLTLMFMGVALLATALAFLRHMRSIAQRMPDRWLSRATLATSMWLILVLLTMLLVLLLAGPIPVLKGPLDNLATYARRRWIPTAFWIDNIVETSIDHIFTAAWLGMVSFILVALALLPWYAHRLRHAAHIAGETWAEKRV